MQSIIEGMAAQALRCIGFAYRLVDELDVPAEESHSDWKIPDGGLILMAIAGIKVQTLLQQFTS